MEARSARYEVSNWRSGSISGVSHGVSTRTNGKSSGCLARVEGTPAVQKETSIGIKDAGPSWRPHSTPEAIATCSSRNTSYRLQ